MEAKKYICNICNKKYKSPQSLSNHKKLYHTQNIKTLDITDESILNEYINTQIINNDILIQDIKLSNINNKNTYNYRLINETNNIDLNIFESNKINISSFDIGK